MKARVLLGFTSLTLLAFSATADILFYDNFESGSLSSALWANAGTGFVTNDPTGAINKVLAFGHGSSGGDVFGVLISNVAVTYRLDFDFYEAAAPSPIANSENIGYIGTDQDALPGGPNEQWVWNARDNPVMVGKWNHVSLDVTPLTHPFDLKLEVAGPNSSAAGIYFDNITLSTVPEPSSLWLLGGVALGLLIRHRFLRASH
jgi:hypothetical protein